MAQPYVDPSIFKSELQSLGGVRGKKEYRRHLGTHSIIGRADSCTYIRGKCWNCRHGMIARRPGKGKGLAKCPKCNKTSFINGGYYNSRTNPHPWIPPQPEECVDGVKKFRLSRDSEYSDPVISYGLEESEDGYWDTVEILEEF